MSITSRPLIRHVIINGGSLCLWLSLLGAVALLEGCRRGEVRGAAENQPAPVVAGWVIEKTVPIQIRAIGNVQAFSSVTMKSRIGGQLQQVHFIEGQEVKKGDLLFTIDPRPYQAAVQKAQATLAQDRALAENATMQAVREEELFKQKLVSPSDYDKARYTAQSQKATVTADEAALANAQLQLSYCYLHAPMDGRTGALQSYVGANIKADDTAMVDITQVHPIYVAFSVPEQDLSRVIEAMNSGRPRVQVFVTSNIPEKETGTLKFIDNRVDVNTGTIQLKAVFENQQRRLWPGQYVRVVLILGEQPHAIVVPSQAVQTGQNGQHVFVIREDMTVEMRPVRVGRSIDDLTVVEKGLRLGERVVTDGQIRLTAGTKVRVQDHPVGGEQEGGPGT